MTALASLLQLQTQLITEQHRAAVRIMLDQSDSISLIKQYCQQLDLSAANIAWFGGFNELEARLPCQNFTYKQGSQILGQDVDLLIFDCAVGFDANSFTAACGALKAGGLLLILNSEQLPSSYSHTWLLHYLQYWPEIDAIDSPLKSGALMDAQPKADQVKPLCDQNIKPNRFIEGKTQDQICAIAAIQKVVSGHRKRPLVLTAHRGRGKSACLGMAAAQLMAEQQRTIIVTAPSIKALSSVFEHAILQLEQQQVGHNSPVKVQQQTRLSLILDNGSCLQFVAPDELLLTLPECDLLLVDEAAALPLAMLKRMTQHYHRMVFSSTVHGYEGCGRGFTLKFMQWLVENRKGWKQLELQQPIRWQQDDPLELWLFDAFLLACDMTPAPTSYSDVKLKPINKSQLLAEPELLRSVFGLLVNAHYQTAPNDLFQLLDDDAMSLYLIQSQASLLGCLVINLEGGLSDDLVTAIQQGKRRPKGHLVASHLTNHLGLKDAALQTSARIMRIAVHPQLQGQGIGQQALNLLQLQLIDQVDFISTSFGATPELVRFWSEQFSLVKLGSHRDQASGCYSAIMVAPLSFEAQVWIEGAHSRFGQQFKFLLSNLFQALETEVVFAILTQQLSKQAKLDKSALITNYLAGGNSFESVSFDLTFFVWQRLCGNAAMIHTPHWSCLIAKLLQQQTWQQVSASNALSGRKETEQYIKQHISQL
ncbi:GNAT family N-acetyltransferase [Vibrio algicola]|uniref:tRNA(Met) cytidine acetyltransferase TmcA n=1 Tax=Vibrio algicola TaxID=2662262 RepID=A0A5Q0TG05_9VIBR|nr:GNAT family N-acetyltransferase [Vibrio algicola]